MNGALDAPGDLVHVTQRTFRLLLGALSHPGRITQIAERVDAPAALGDALGAAALTLFDRDIAVWLDDGLPPEAAAWLVERTGCRVTSDPRAAAFGVVTTVERALPLARWNGGSAEDPEDSATLLVRAAALLPAAGVTLRGPGIETAIELDVHAAPAAFWREWAANADRYPQGVDCFLFDASNVAGLPRTARVDTR